MPNEIPDNEPELLLHISQGDTWAFRQLFTAYSGKVYALAIKLTKDAELAKDLTQEIFARLWVKREQLGGVLHFQGFLTTMALNLIRNHFRRKVLNAANEAFLANYFEESAMAPDRAMEFKEFQCMVQEAVDHLPPQLNRSFTLSRMAGMSHAEIARQMELSPLTVKSHIARALTHIRAYLEQHAVRTLTLVCVVIFKKIF